MWDTSIQMLEISSTCMLCVGGGVGYFIHEMELILFVESQTSGR